MTPVYRCCCCRHTWPTLDTFVAHLRRWWN